MLGLEKCRRELAAGGVQAEQVGEGAGVPAEGTRHTEAGGGKVRRGGVGGGGALVMKGFGSYAMEFVSIGQWGATDGS